MGTEEAPGTKAEPRKCRDRKAGKIDLTCELDEGHVCEEHAPEPCPPGCEGGWHYAECTWHQEVRYDGSRHDTTTREVVYWEPVDHVAEATRHLMAATRRRRPDDD
jgi:hypothetical protein